MCRPTKTATSVNRFAPAREDLPWRAPSWRGRPRRRPRPTPRTACWCAGSPTVTTARSRRSTTGTCGRRSRWPGGSPATRCSPRRWSRRSSWRSGGTRPSTTRSGAGSRAGCSRRPTTRRWTRSAASRPCGPGGRAWPRRPTTTPPPARATCRRSRTPRGPGCAVSGYARRCRRCRHRSGRRSCWRTTPATRSRRSPQRTGAPLGTVKTRMLAGMRRLRLLLDEVADPTEGGRP